MTEPQSDPTPRCEHGAPLHACTATEHEPWRPPFCPDPTGCKPLIHPLTDGDNPTLDKRGFAVFCWGRLTAPLVWTFDDVEHVETLSTCQSSPLKGVVRWLENESDWSALLRSYRAAVNAAHEATEPRP